MSITGYTIWSDILESEAGIKAHHNAGGLPEDMNFELVYRETFHMLQRYVKSQ